MIAVTSGLSGSNEDHGSRSLEGHRTFEVEFPQPFAGRDRTGVRLVFSTPFGSDQRSFLDFHALLISLNMFTLRAKKPIESR